MPVSRWCSRANFGELSRVAGTRPPGKARALPRPTPVAAPLRGAVFLEESSLAQNLSARKADATGQAAGALGPTFWQLSLYRWRHQGAIGVPIVTVIACSEPTPEIA